jgi:hypothetical protein
MSVEKLVNSSQFDLFEVRRAVHVSESPVGPTSILRIGADCRNLQKIEPVGA